MNICFLIVCYKLNSEKRQTLKKEYSSIKVKQNELVKKLKLGFKKIKSHKKSTFGKNIYKKYFLEWIVCEKQKDIRY